ncbi:MAG: non-homologous end-joining DNA ligase [Fulvivirga sp.]
MKHIRIEGGTKLSNYIKPMLAKLSDEPAFDHPDWVFEIKWDGYRAVAEIADTIRFYSRNGTTFQKAYPKIYDELRSVEHDAIIDGEVIAFGKDGKPSFQALQNYNNRKNVPVLYYVFDCIEFEGRDITTLPLHERKEILKQLLPESKIIRYCDHIIEGGKVFYDEIVRADLEGMIAKHKDSLYYKGKRSSSWLKIKNIQSEEAVIVGYTDPKGSRLGFGALMLAKYEDDQLKYIGNIGTGFNDKLLTELYIKLIAIKRESSPLDISIKETKEMHWVEPVYTCKIKFTEKTEQGIIRHPVFLGLV